LGLAREVNARKGILRAVVMSWDQALKLRNGSSSAAPMAMQRHFCDRSFQLAQHLPEISWQPFF
jgi:hypothetical protein